MTKPADLTENSLMEGDETAVEGPSKPRGLIFFLTGILEGVWEALSALWAFMSGRKTKTGVFLLFMWFVLDHEAENWEWDAWWIEKVLADLWFWSCTFSGGGGLHKGLKSKESVVETVSQWFKKEEIQK